MTATGSEGLLIDTGSLMVPLLSNAQMQESLGIPVDEVVRLEHVAELLGPNVSATDFPLAYAQALRLASAEAVGFKSVIAYRYGLDLDSVAPSTEQVVDAAGRWLSRAEETGSYRLADPVLLQFLIWTAIPLGKPIQFHVGYGDSDIELFRADPSRATKFFIATADLGCSFTLLHCYPFVREAAVLSQVFPHVYCDVGSMVHFLGPSAPTVIRQVMEIAPFEMFCTPPTRTRCLSSTWSARRADERGSAACWTSGSLTTG